MLEGQAWRQCNLASYNFQGFLIGSVLSFQRQQAPGLAETGFSPRGVSELGLFGCGRLPKVESPSDPRSGDFNSEPLPFIRTVAYISGRTVLCLKHFSGSGAIKGYKLKLIMPENMSLERQGAAKSAFLLQRDLHREWPVCE